MDIKGKKINKSQFITGPLTIQDAQKLIYLESLHRVLSKESAVEIIAHVPEYFSIDKKERPLLLTSEIVEKIQGDHGLIVPENLIINDSDWEYVTTNVLGNPDKINLIKHVPNSHNYLLIAAVKVNGYFIITHFETKSSEYINLKRLLKRGDVISRGPSIGLHTNQDNESTREGI